MQKGNILIFLLVGILILAGVAGGAYYLGTKKSSSPTQIPVTITQTQLPTPSPFATPNPIDETSNWKTYTNTKFGYSYKYPNNYEVKGNEGDANLHTVTTDVDGTIVVPSDGNMESRIFSTLLVGKDNAEDVLKTRFMPGDPITVTPLSVGDVNGFKVVTSDTHTPSGVLVKGPGKDTFYYFKAGNGSVIQITVLNISTVANQILSTFKFQ